MLRRLRVITLLLLLPGIPGRTQESLFTRYTIDAGLSQSVANCVHQDREGFIWIGTQNGLNLFNGYTFEVFQSKPSDTNTLSNNWIYSIDEDRDGNLWIGTKQGLNQYIRKEKRFRRFTWQVDHPGNITELVYDAKVGRTGKILINTPPVLTLFDPVSGSFEHYFSDLTYERAVIDNSIPLLEDRHGRIWTGSMYGLACFDQASRTFIPFRQDKKKRTSFDRHMITALYESDDGVIWCGTSDGILTIHPEKLIHQQFFAFSAASPTAVPGIIRAITSDNKGGFWIGTEGDGLLRLLPDGPNKWVLTKYTHEDHSIGHNIVLSLLVDRSENLWLGTLDGVSKTDLKKPKFNLYRTSHTPTPINLLGNVIASVHKDTTGLVWVGNWGQGLNIVNRNTGKVEHYASRFPGKHHLPNDFVHVIFRDNQQNIWVGTRNGILVFDRQSGRFVPLHIVFGHQNTPRFDRMRIFKVIQTRDGGFWVATHGGAWYFRNDRRDLRHFSVEGEPSRKLSGNLVYDLIEDREGLIWFATLGGLDIFHPVTGTITHLRNQPENPNSLCDNFVTALCEDRSGDIWVGTNSGLNRFSKSDSAFRYFTREDGFPSNLVYAIVRDQQDNVWFATNNGLCRYDTTNGRFRTYTVAEGLQSREFNLHASVCSFDGEVFCGGMNGFNAFYPDSLTDNPYLPAIVLTSCYRTARGERINLDISAGQVVLPYDNPTLTIEFAALEYTQPERNQFAYKLEGISEEWISTGTRHFVVFSGLPPGDYIFSVKGSNNDGLWNESASSLQIVIRPPWWRSTWALVAYLLLAAAFILLYIRIRERNLVRERDLLEEKVRLRTLKIEDQNQQLSDLNSTKDKFFSIIAHDLRNPFNTILGLTEMTLGNLVSQDLEKTRKALTDIRDTSRHAFDLLQNLLIWARSQTNSLEFNPVSVDLAERIYENISLVKTQAGRKEITIEFEQKEPLFITADLRMIDTVIRNLLTNAIKFTGKQGRIAIRTNLSDDVCQVTVSDNGIGIAQENIPKLFRLDSKYTRKGTDQEKGSGLGLILCREFIEKHHGTIHLESEQGKGSSITFTLPR